MRDMEASHLALHSVAKSGKIMFLPGNNPGFFGREFQKIPDRWRPH